ncbi:TMEM175 family protein [Pseudomarimonas salicorniae]|uniref:TMEM175 family protein n=1 Tax=Pseudomarimonas salicorniae TaxID=2933270 RepID=A0ABT0GHD3_9GAMM|nr:TMEM175 family protein [Lysobacter sp. CAU 1642]MCK7593457.1 TMEM175 family protein [Lysobacter sp. CAU 1642]
MASALSAVGIERGDKVTRLEAFVDASFAFALTLLVISGDTIPGSIGELTDALKQIPTYALSFNLIAQFWSSHALWSRWFGLDDALSRRLSLTLVFVLLIFVYPLKMVFAAFFHAISAGWLPATFTLQSDVELLVMFQVFAVGYGSMAIIMALLFAHAARMATPLGFTPIERMRARHHRTNWLVVAGFCALSFALTLILPTDRPLGHWLGLPGYILFGLFVFQFIRWRVFVRRERRMEAAG